MVRFSISVVAFPLCVLSACAASVDDETDTLSAAEDVEPTASPLTESCWPGTVSGMKVHYCHNRSNAAVLNSAERGAPVVDRLKTNPSWFVCRLERGPHGGGGPHPNRWLYTQGDAVNPQHEHKYGWVADTDVASETNSVERCEEIL